MRMMAAVFVCLLTGCVSPSDYMVIDLSSGPGAESYPVSYLGAVPSGGWTDAYKTTKLVMRKMPQGTFTMGSPTNELGRFDNETQHTVTLTQDFYIGVFEITQRQWELVMGNKPSYFNNATYYASRPVEQVSYFEIRENPANSEINPNWPQSSQVHADSFMGKLRAKTGLATFDLPTESQWEYACRAGTSTALNSGKNLTDADSCPNMSEVGRYWHNCESEFPRNGNTSGRVCELGCVEMLRGSEFPQNVNTSVATGKVGSYLPNAWGLYDMHGNVWEWCLDWYGAYPGTVENPRGAAAWVCRVNGGGGWGNSAFHCRSAFRSDSCPDERIRIIGFRVARTLP
jgi:formylglycine-generating enzyme required for sulfatase activity